MNEHFLSIARAKVAEAVEAGNIQLGWEDRYSAFVSVPVQQPGWKIEVRYGKGKNPSQYDDADEAAAALAAAWETEEKTFAEKSGGQFFNVEKLPAAAQKKARHDRKFWNYRYTILARRWGRGYMVWPYDLAPGETPPPGAKIVRF